MLTGKIELICKELNVKSTGFNKRRIYITLKNILKCHQSSQILPKRKVIRPRKYNSQEFLLDHKFQRNKTKEKDKIGQGNKENDEHKEEEEEDDDEDNDDDDDDNDDDDDDNDDDDDDDVCVDGMNF